MKKIFSKVPYIIIAVLIGVTVSYAGSLTPPGPVANTMYTLTDIYNLSAGTTATLGSGTIPATPGSVVATGKTLTEVYDALSTQVGNLSAGILAKDESAFGFTGTLYGDTDPSKVLTSATYPGTATAGGLPQTGQTHCNAFSGDYGSASQVPCSGTHQDGQSLKGIARSYTDNSNGTISDNATGLMWQKCSNGQSGADCSGGSADPLVFDDGNGDQGAGHFPAIDYCENLSLASQTDWRLPNRFELESITDLGRVSPAVDTTYFPNTQSGYYWSSTAYEDGALNAWVVYFYDGSVGNDRMSNGYFVRCVRG